MKSKKIAHETNALIGTFAVLAVLVLLAIVSEGFYHFRLDLTAEKEFTLSNASIKTLESLPDPITIKAVISSELPSQFVQVKTRVKDLLDEFKARAKGKVEIQYIDPGSDEELKKQVQQMGIQEVQMQEQSKQGIEVKKGFFGMVITYGDKKEVIPVLANLENFEYDMVVKIKKLVGQVKTIGVFDGTAQNQYSFTLPGNPPQSKYGFADNFAVLKGEVEKLYKIEPADLSKPVPPTYDMLLVIAPRHISDVEKFHLDQYIMLGRSILFLTPGIEVSLMQGISAAPSNTNYEDLLAHYGLGVKKNVIVEDRQFQMVPFGGSFFPIPYPYWITLDPRGLSKTSAVTSRVGTLSFPWASSLDIDTSHADSNLQILAKSTPGSWDESGNVNLLPRDLKEFVPLSQQSHPLAALKTATYTSFFANRPPIDSSLVGEVATMLTKGQAESRILVVGNALFASDFYINLMRAGSNISFMLNAVDQLALDPDLIKIRSRAIASRPIPEEYQTKKLGIVLANLLVAPLILLGAGIFVGLRRKKRDALA